MSAVKRARLEDSPPLETTNVTSTKRARRDDESDVVQSDLPRYRTHQSRAGHSSNPTARMPAVDCGAISTSGTFSGAVNVANPAPPSGLSVEQQPVPKDIIDLAVASMDDAAVRQLLSCVLKNAASALGGVQGLNLNIGLQQQQDHIQIQQHQHIYKATAPRTPAPQQLPVANTLGLEHRYCGPQPDVTLDFDRYCHELRKILRREGTAKTKKATIEAIALLVNEIKKRTLSATNSSVETVKSALDTLLDLATEIVSAFSPRAIDVRNEIASRRRGPSTDTMLDLLSSMSGEDRERLLNWPATRGFPTLYKRVCEFMDDDNLCTFGGMIDVVRMIERTLGIIDSEDDDFE